jgi:dolichyl-phosphate-mannose--protein O-mannosyl transferase
MKRMREIMTGDPGTHPYSSVWWQWPTLYRPVWYEFQIPGGDASSWSDTVTAYGVVSLPNPLATAIGEVAVLALLLRWARTRDWRALVVVSAFFSQYLPWIINPKGLEFQYYFFPSLVCIGPALAVALAGMSGERGRRTLVVASLVGSAAFFVFFLPVLNAAIGDLSPTTFERRIWFDSWR